MLAVRNRTKLIVGIDYGTTYSGLSFALSNAADFKDIHPWTKYPGSSTHIAEHCHKAPSWVAFKDENPDLDENAWGYQIEPAKLITRAAALDAGFASRPIDRLSLITEPDAAAHMALKSSIHHVEDLIDVGTGVMVCDLGGGTVDITTSEVVRKSPSLKLREIAIGAEIEKYYDPDFNWVLLSKDDMKSLFDPVIDVILKLVKDQVDQVKRDNEPRIKTMCLVGGFGSSPYVKERLLEWCSEQEIRLTTPWTGAWAAVVCGAVLRGVEGSMSKQKKCRRHYGHTMSRTYDPAVHFNFDENKRRLWNDPWTKEQNLSGFMNWEIAKGALLDDDTEISTSFYSHFSEYFDGKHTHDLFSCSLDEAPETIENERIEKVGEVLYTIDGIDKTKIKSIQDANGIHWYQLLLTLTIRLSDDEVGVLVCRIYYRGKEVGKAEIGYSFT
ncbi:hypothetical protein FOC4_g10002707 [Fusarium odoratissimum]|uniref:Hsp70 protein n=1 Tax=Fusarium oxysporum f. sp. cubense (strain race 4) TaxID=2502994 RepID=N1S8Z8_FUSC4|nr:hypothetical protein FOC4_g10002707 [Fusarium odoratissimum]